MQELRKKKKMSYDDSNIFAKILRGEIPCKKIYEDDFVLSFYDINPQKKIHALVIPKGKYLDLDDFSANASPDEMVGLLKGINIVAKKLQISADTGKGYRALANISEHGGQEVSHLHFHLFWRRKSWQDGRVNKKVERNYLEITSLKDLRGSFYNSDEYTVEIVNPVDFQLNKFFYKNIGKNHNWVDRLVWTEKQLDRVCVQFKS